MNPILKTEDISDVVAYKDESIDIGDVIFCRLPGSDCNIILKYMQYMEDSLVC